MSGHRAVALRAFSAAMLFACLIGPAGAVDAETYVEFRGNRIGAPPENFDFAITGQGSLGRWIVVRDVTAIGGAAVEQSSDDPTEDRLLLAIYRPLSLKNVNASVRFKLTKGAMKTAGIIFRWVNADNYYVASANALEGRVDLFRVLAGKPERIGGVEADVVLDHWQILGVLADNNRFTISLDNRPLFTVSDRTFSNDGRIGLWTQEDTVARFDQLVITALPWSEEL